MSDSNEQAARQHVSRLKSFYQQVSTYLIINVVLIIINLLVDPHELWFYWVLIFWGIGIALQAVRLFGPGKKFDKDWEDKKVKEYLEKDRRKKDD